MPALWEATLFSHCLTFPLLEAQIGPSVSNQLRIQLSTPSLRRLPTPSSIFLSPSAGNRSGWKYSQALSNVTFSLTQKEMILFRSRLHEDTLEFAVLGCIEELRRGERLRNFLNWIPCLFLIPFAPQIDLLVTTLKSWLMTSFQLNSLQPLTEHSVWALQPVWK